MAEQEKRLVPVGMEQEAPPPAPAPKKKEPKKEPMTVGGFLENVAENAKDIVMGVTNAMTISAKASADIIKQAEWLPELAKHPEWLGQELWNTTKAVGKATIEPYQKHGLRVGYEEPLTVLGDIATVLSGGGAALGKAGKLSKLSKLEALGKAIEAVPGKAAQTLTEVPLRMMRINPESRKALLTLEREERTIGEVTKKKLNQVLDEKFKGFTDQDKALLDKLAVEGGSAAELAASPKVAEALEAYRGIVKEIREAQLGEKGRRLLTTEQMEEAVAKKYANRKYGKTDAEAVRAAKAEMEAMEIKPVYTPAIGEGKKIGIMDMVWGPDEIRLGKVGFLEPFKGGKFGMDPIQYMKKAVDDFVDTETRLRFMDRVIQDPKLIKPIVKGETALGQAMPEGIYKKYFDDRARAQAVGVRDIKTKHGIQEAERLLMSDPVTQKYVKSIANLGAVDPTVAQYLRWTFTRASGRLGAVLKVYDSVLNAFKMSATTLNPRFYTGNIVGDGILSVMAGEYGLHWKTAKRILDSLPPELRVGGRAATAENAILSKFQRVADIAQAADDLARAGIWTKEVAAKFKQAGSSFGAVEQTMEDFLRTVGQSVEDLSGLQMKAQLLDEHIARSTPELLKATTDLKRLEDKAIKFENAAYAARKKGKVAQAERYTQRRNGLHNMAMDVAEKRDGLLATMREQMKQSGEYAQRIPEVQKYSEVARQATDRANAFLGDYFGLGPIERAVFRRVVPFYSFTKAMTKLAFTYPLIAPKSAFLWHRFSQAYADMVGDPAMPEWMAGYFPVGGAKNGDSYWIRLSGLGPFGGVRSGRVGEMPIPSLLAFWQQNPIIRLGYRMVGGRDEFYWAGRPKGGETWVNVGDGRVHRFRPDGTIETVVPQMPVIEGLATLFPTVQMIHQAMANYDVQKGDEKDRKGELKYPMSSSRYWIELLGPRVKEGKASAIRQAEKNRIMGIFKDLERQYPRMSPEQREYVRELFRDYRQGYYRKFRVAQ